MSFNDLDPSCLKQIFSFLRGDDCARLACTAPLWRDAAGSSDLWEGFIQREYHQEAGKLGDVSSVHSSTLVERSTVQQQSVSFAFKETYQKLHLLRRRSRNMWRKLEGWCEENATQISESLQAGATEAQIQEVERELDVTFPEAFKQIYREHNGQLLNYDQCLDDDNNGSVVRPDGSIFAGLFGGYSFYNHFVCTRMLPLKRMVKWTTWMRESDRIRERGSGEKRDPDEHHYVLFAASYVFNKAFFLDTRDASVYVWTVDRIHFLRAIPEQRDSGVLDGILRWMEVYADRLRDGTYQMTALLDDGEDTAAQQMDPSRGICLFPAREPGLAAAVTRGVQVRTSSLFAPELSMVSTTGNATFTLAYSVEFSLLSKDQQGSDQAVDRVKLRSRHWSVLDANGKEFSNVNGAAVIGKYPDLSRFAGPLMKNALYEMEQGTDAKVNNNTANNSSPGLDGEHASRFRVIAYVVQAVRRFKKSLNPTITFGKRPSEEISSRTLSEGASMRQNTSQYRALTGSLKKTGSRRVTSYLFQPLPEVESK